MAIESARKLVRELVDNPKFVEELTRRKTPEERWEYLRPQGYNFTTREWDAVQEEARQFLAMPQGHEMSEAQLESVSGAGDDFGAQLHVRDDLSPLLIEPGPAGKPQYLASWAPPCWASTGWPLRSRSASALSSRGSTSWGSRKPPFAKAPHVSGQPSPAPGSAFPIAASP